VRGRVTFKESDITRALRAAVKVGLRVVGFEISPVTGNILVHTDKSEDEGKEESNPWDRIIGHGEDR
jgi:hypothetical protein